MDNTRRIKRSRTLLRLRTQAEDTARRQQAGILCRLEAVEGRLDALHHTLAEYDAAVRDDLIAGRRSLVLGQYARRTSDIRGELARLADRKQLLDEALLRGESELIEAHRARKSAQRYHEQLVRAADVSAMTVGGSRANEFRGIDGDRQAFDWEGGDVY